jgi:thiol-disulfide isomerase/thioredoxin
MKNKLALFYMKECEPCKYQKPLIEKLSKAYKLELELIPAHEDEGFKFSKKYNVTIFPTLFLIEEEIIKEALLGYDLNSSEEENKNRIVNILKQLKFIN